MRAIGKAGLVVAGVVALAAASAAGYWFGAHSRTDDAAAAAAVEPEPADGFTVARLVEIRREVAEQLLDPESAYFRDVEVKRGELGYVVCGRVSGRNGFGGYSEAMPFYYNNKEAKVINIGSSVNEHHLRLKLLPMEWHCNGDIIRTLNMNALP